MEAKNYQLQNILNGSHQYMVPIYQRQYSWRDHNWKQLWSDVTELLEEGETDHHFLGSIVAKAFDAKAGGIARFLLIDGQQRLTTLTLLIAAIRDHLKDVNAAEHQKLASKLHDLYLINQYESGDDQYKVLPTKADRAAYAAVIDRRLTFVSPEEPVLQAYLWFHRTIGAARANDQLDLAELVNRLVSGVEIVSITLSEDDNDYRIFESLNAKGTPLTQTDLLRNFFLMRFDGHDQDRIYSDLVAPMTIGVNDVDKASSDTMFQYSMQRTGAYVRDKDVYAAWKRHCDDFDRATLESTLQEIKRDADNYLKLIDPSREASSVVRDRLMRFRQFGIMTPTPFLLNVLRWRDDGRLDDRQAGAVIDLILSFLVRRMFCSVSTQALNRMFIRLSEQLPQQDDLVLATHQALSDPGRRWPTEAEFRERFPLYRLFKDSRPHQRRLVLEELERAARSKESPVLEELQIEHIMPQTLNGAWHAELGPNAPLIQSKYVDTIGNLTLTGYNPELGNMQFAKKRERYQESNVQLTRQVAKYDRWDEQSIVDRAERLYRVASQIWVGPLPV